ncbi:hypothetical protein [Natrinema halophilum]|uniref:Uncharacterized protein n=1 Tax=Natrinema halophilum TaxID=1699371 RepID=A0A7D5GND7_9EURY|nr:hypothetical protein [Natrinema halophilum]QLG50832.1 hypothetical protein HYG82_19325 [Natrinema halophilum]
MQTLEVTDEQYAFIQHLREEISESVVGKYGFVREQDAVQFLIDNLDEDVEVAADGDFDSSATDDVSASVVAAIDDDADPDEFEEVSYIEDESVNTDRTPDENPDDRESESDGSDDSEADGSAEDGGSADDEEATSDADGDDTGTSDDDGSADDDTGTSNDDGSADDDDMLDEMMSLLETYDDKWEESDSADYRYAVELPDGSTDQVQTKDDVRALLFKNYR